MNFKAGNEKLISRIEKAVSGGNISHAYIIEGDSISDKMSFAKDFVKEILDADALLSDRIDHENFEDLYIVRAEAGTSRSVKSIKDADMEELQSNLKMKPHGRRNIAIIENADSMTIRAQNRFLKTLEEPTEGTVILLLSENQENLLDTIRSRCITYHIFDEDNTSGYSETALSLIDGMKFSEMKKKVSDEIKSREDAFMLLDSMENSFRNILLGRDEKRSRLFKKEESIRAIELIEETRKDLIMNMNYSYAIKNLFLKLEG